MCPTVKEHCAKCTANFVYYETAAGPTQGTCKQNQCTCKDEFDLGGAPVGTPKTGQDCTENNGNMCETCTNALYLLDKTKPKNQCVDNCGQVGGACSPDAKATPKNGVLTGKNVWEAKNGKCCAKDKYGVPWGNAKQTLGVPGHGNALKCQTGVFQTDDGFQGVIRNVNDVTGKGEFLYGPTLNTCIVTSDTARANLAYQKFKESQKSSGSCTNDFECTNGLKCESNKCKNADNSRGHVDGNR
jgi:hypothetical protein